MNNKQGIYPGTFITFEGPDGSGKTVQQSMLDLHLRQRGVDVVSTREPGGTVIGDQIRRILFDLDNTGMHPRTEILLFQASRAQHVEKLILPALQDGRIVLCDRFADSTIAYQGFGHRLDIEKLVSIVGFATGGLKPDLTLLLDLDVGKGLMRREKGGDWNRLDAYDLAFHERVRSGYLQMAVEEPERWVVVDANRPVDLIQAEIREIVGERLRGKGKV